MLVSRRRGRQGLGRRLMSHAIERVGGVVALTATDYGRPLYTKLGFEALGSSTTYVGELPAAAMRTRPATAADMGAIIERDAAAFGADRTRLLARLPGFARLRVAAHGYGAAWSNGGLTVIGPVVADDVDTARSLITDLAAGHTPIRLDIATHQPELATWAARHLTPGETTTVMAYGGTPPGDPTRLFTPFSVATA
jgi:Acetyltransferase (GNAT) domain